MISYPWSAIRRTSWCTLVTSGHTASTTTPALSLAPATTWGADPWAESITGAPSRDLVDVVDEDDTGPLEGLHHPLVVDDLVVAVDGRLEDPHHPGEGLDRHLDTGAEPAWLGEQYTVNHSPNGRNNGAQPVLASPRVP